MLPGLAGLVMAANEALVPLVRDAAVSGWEPALGIWLDDGPRQADLLFPL
jgi:hypothetical protein